MSWRVAVVVMILMGATACATPTRLYMPTVADKPHGEAGYQTDLAACKTYEENVRFGVALGGATAQLASGNGLFDTPNDVVDSCMSQRGYQVLSNGGRY